MSISLPCLCVCANVLGDLEWCRGHLLDVLQLYSLGQLYQCDTTVLPVDIEDGEIRNDSANASDSGLGEFAFGNDLGVAVLVKVVSDNNNLESRASELCSYRSGTRLTFVLSGFEQRSMAPPIPLTSLPGIM